MASNQYDSQASTNYKEAFSLYDKRGNGRVALESLGDLLRACGQNPTLSEIQDLEKNVGSDFDFETFQRILNRPGGFRDPGEPDEYCRGFQVFDKDMTGFIGVGQLKYILTNLGEKMSDDEVEELLKAVDTSSGQVNYTALAEKLKLDNPKARPYSRPFGFLFVLLPLLVLILAATLAPQRAFTRISSLAQHFKRLPTPTATPRRPFTTMAGTRISDKYRSPPQAPPLFTATPESILSDTSRLNNVTKSVMDKVVADVSLDKATFANVLEPILKDDNKDWIQTFYAHVSTDAALREASTKAEEIAREFSIECRMREDVFRLVDAAYSTRESQSLEPEPAHILAKYRQQYIRNGLLLPAGPKRDRFKEIQKRISALSVQGQKNLNEEKGVIWFTPKELEGVPPDDIDIDSLEKGTGENEGKVKLTFKYNHFFPLMKHCVNGETRRTFMMAESNKSNINVPIFQEIIELRDEAARLLGYENHASVKLEENMAKTPKKVLVFLGDLRTRLAPGGKKDADKLLEYKKKDLEERGVPFDGNLYMWDVPFYSRMLKEKEYSIDEIKISQYFPVESTFAGMLQIFEKIFGLVFVKLEEADRARLSPTGKADDIRWHEDVVLYSVWDEEEAGGGFVGYLYLDLHPRDNKYGHNANFNLEPGYIKDDGSRHYPATALVCNFSKPSPSKPALLKHHEVVTLFHELGHGIHDLSGRTRFSYTHGTNTVSDFVEAPSQMLENWCWTPNVLRSLSRHWETNEPIPEELVERLVKTKHFNSATNTLAQLVVGIFDMTVHTPESAQAVKELNPGRLWNQIRHDISGIKGPEDQGEGLEWGNRHATIGHFIGGYDAGYYGYLWSEVFSTDMFYSFFKQNPMDGEQGRRYRRTVLQRGGSIDEMEFLKEFLGREPSTEQFYKELGLSN
ncbi:hypothetical protein S40293_08513 [Stachybotrys chartarum IBT 40293]|nr:hypothetical protein S40293_08513 [Stachybotrys chartarum IBT 40293]